MTVLAGRLALETINYNQAGWDAIHNTNMQRLNDMVEKLVAVDPVLDKDLNTPPGSPTTGDRYIISTSPTGAWSGKAKNVTEWNGVEWRFTAPLTRFTAYVKDEKRYYHYNEAGNWIAQDYSSTADVTLSNTTAETSMIGGGIGNLSLPANFFTIGKTLKIQARGVFSTQATPPTLNMRVKLGSTVIVSSGDQTPDDTLSNRMWKIDCILTCRTVGGSGTVIAQAAFEYIAANPGSPVWFEMTNTAAVTVDTTAGQALDLTAQWGSGVNSTDSIKCTNFIVEVLN